MSLYGGEYVRHNANYPELPCKVHFMNPVLSSIVSEFETEEQAASYGIWFRAKVQASLDDPHPSIPHDQVMAEMDAIIAEAEKQHRKQA